MLVLIILSSVAGVCGQAYSTGAQDTISRNASPIVIYRDSYSPTSLVHILINAPDFNSNPYAIDTIGDDSENKIIVSTRESGIPYRLVETGTDTGIFTGYVILSGTTSVCLPVCGPTDGFLEASGDDAITVSFTYAQGRTITSTSTGFTQDKNSNQTIPEFGALAGLVVTISIIGSIMYSVRWTKIM